MNFRSGLRKNSVVVGSNVLPLKSYQSSYVGNYLLN